MLSVTTARTYIKKLFRELGMVVPKSKGTIVDWLVTNVLEHLVLCYVHLLDASLSQNFGRQKQCEIMP